MKRIFCAFVTVFFLAGCSAAQTFETVADVYSPQAAILPREVRLAFDRENNVPVMKNENGAIYLCDGYEVMVQTFSGGDLNATLQELTGFDRSRLAILETGAADIARYECAWTAAGEGGDVVARAVVLDDGHFHYCVTVMADDDVAGILQETWGELLQSFALV